MTTGFAVGSRKSSSTPPPIHLALHHGHLQLQLISTNTLAVHVHQWTIAAVGALPRQPIWMQTVVLVAQVTVSCAHK